MLVILSSLRLVRCGRQTRSQQDFIRGSGFSKTTFQDSRRESVSLFENTKPSGSIGHLLDSLVVCRKGFRRFFDTQKKYPDRKNQCQNHIRRREGRQSTPTTLYSYVGEHFCTLCSQNFETEEQFTVHFRGHKLNERHNSRRSANFGLRVRTQKFSKRSSTRNGITRSETHDVDVHKWTQIEGDAPTIFGLGKVSAMQTSAAEIRNDFAVVKSKRMNRFLSITDQPCTHTVSEMLPSWKRMNRKDDSCFPIHAPKVDIISDLLFSHAKISRSQCFQYLHNKKLYPHQRYEVKHFPKSTLKQKDFDTLVENGILQHDKSSNSHFGYCFPVTEFHKSRRRCVHDTLSANVLCSDPEKVQFTSIPKLRRVLFQGSFAFFTYPQGYLWVSSGQLSLHRS